MYKTFTYLVALLQPSFLGGATRHGPHDARKGAPVRPGLAAHHPHAKSTRCNKGISGLRTKYAHRQYNAAISADISPWVGFASSRTRWTVHVSDAGAAASNGNTVSQRCNSRTVSPNVSPTAEFIRICKCGRGAITSGLGK